MKVTLKYYNKLGELISFEEIANRRVAYGFDVGLGSIGELISIKIKIKC